MIERKTKIPAMAGIGLLAAVLGCAPETPGSTMPTGESRAADLIFINAVVVTMDDAFSVHDPGFVAVQGHRIVGVGPSSGAAAFKAARTIDAAGHLLLPGLVNGHQHAPMSLLRGIADDLELMEWLRSYIFPAEAKNVDPDFVYWGTLLAAAEMIRTGTTTYADMYYFEGSVAEATARIGMRGVLGETIIDFPSPDYPDPQEALAGTRDYLSQWKDHPLVTPAVAPHSPYICSTETLKSSQKLAEEFDVPLLIHLAETEDEVQQVRDKANTTPARYLSEIGFLSDRVVAAHAVWVDAEEIELLAGAGVGVIHNPESNMKLASGTAPVPDMLAAALDVGIGTDGPASNNNIDLLQEIDTMAKLHKLISRDPTVLDARTALEIATRRGAAALGLGDQIGSIEVGKLADLITLSLDRGPGTPFYDPYSTVVYSLLGDSVRTVVINGEIVFKDGRTTLVDEAEIGQNAYRLKERLLESLKQ